MLRLLLIFFIISCTSYEKFKYLTEDFEIPSETFQADFNQTWAAVVNVMKKYDIELQNQDTGTIKTRWIDNTLEVNFADAFGSSERVKTAKFKLLVNVDKTYKANVPVTKVNVYKRQLVEQDFLQGWKEVRQEHIQEEVILYRIRRYIALDNHLKRIQKQKEQEQIENFL